ncbi:MAG: hypothetical protein ACKOD9_06390, partial [Rubrivivax sp.]
MTAGIALDRAEVPGLERSAARASHSRFVQRIRRRYAGELPQLHPGLPDRASMQEAIARLQAAGRDLGGAMRVTRQLVLERLAVLDVEQAASLDDVTHTMTLLAEVTLEAALAQARLDCDARFGPPRDAVGQDIDFWIVGMGKLGARELNVSSDIDLIYVYEDDGETLGVAPSGAAEGCPRTGVVSAHEYFTQVAKRLFALIGETTDDGFV